MDGELLHLLPAPYDSRSGKPSKRLNDHTNVGIRWDNPDARI